MLQMSEKRKTSRTTPKVSSLLLVLPFWALGVLAALGAQDSSDPATRQGILEFEQAAEAWDGAAFAKASATLAGAASANTSAWLPHYWLAVARFHEVLHGEHTPGVSTAAADRKKAREACEKALEAALRLRPEDAELHAMLGTLHGMRIASDKMSALWLGPKAVQHRDTALEKGGENPRVQYLAGMSYLHGPSILGGTPAAVKALSKAAALFATEAGKAAEPGAPRWGRVNCLAFLGRAQRMSGDTLAAEKSLRAALALDPADRIALAELKKLRP